METDWGRGGLFRHIFLENSKCAKMIAFLIGFSQTPNHRKIIFAEEKAKVVAAARGTVLLQTLAALAILHQDDLKNRMISSNFWRLLYLHSKTYYVLFIPAMSNCKVLIQYQWQNPLCTKYPALSAGHRAVCGKEFAQAEPQTMTLSVKTYKLDVRLI